MANDDKIIPINRPKLTSVTGGKLEAEPQPQPEEPEAPEKFIFQIVTTDGVEFFEEGYLMATPTFIGIGSGNGQLDALIPMAALKYARKTTSADDFAVVDLSGVDDES